MTQLRTAWTRLDKALHFGVCEGRDPIVAVCGHQTTEVEFCDVCGHVFDVAVEPNVFCRHAEDYVAGRGGMPSPAEGWMRVADFEDFAR